MSTKSYRKKDRGSKNALIKDPSYKKMNIKLELLIISQNEKQKEEERLRNRKHLRVIREFRINNSDDPIK